LKDLYVGVPVKLGAGGIKSVIEIDLTDDERSALQHSANAVTELVAAMERLQQEA
jgi:malate dehydrogenase